MSKIGRAFVIIGIFLVLISLSIFGYYQYKSVKAGSNSKKILNDIKENIIDLNDIVDINNNENFVNYIKNNEYFGIISIPILNLELPVMSQYNDNNLEVAPCRYYGEIENNLIICGHSYESHFKNLSKLKQNDIVIITDINNNKNIYEVLEIEILKDTSVEEMLNNNFDLTLYTCTKDGLGRITIRCNKVNNNI